MRSKLNGLAAAGALAAVLALGVPLMAAPPQPPAPMAMAAHNKKHKKHHSKKHHAKKHNKAASHA